MSDLPPSHPPPNGNAWLQPHRLLLATMDDGFAAQLKQSLCTLPVQIERIRGADSVPSRVTHQPVHIVVVDDAAADATTVDIASTLQNADWPGVVIAAVDADADPRTDVLLAAGCFACVARSAPRAEWNAILSLVEQRTVDDALRQDPALRKMMEAALEMLPALADRLEGAAHDQLYDEVDQTLVTLRNTTQLDELQPLTELIDRARALLNPVGAHHALDEMIVEIVELCRGAAVR